MAQPRLVSMVRRFPALIGFVLIAGTAAAQTPPAPSKPTTTPLPPTTTQEPLVNPVGLSEPPPYGWHTDFIGPWRGDFDLSFGIKFWTDTFNFRNLILGGTVDLLPGLRARAQFRRREGEREAFQPDTDEAYLEAFDQYRAPNWNGGVSLRLGRVRYLHFPYPDAISMFDQVPGISDLTGGRATDYRDVLLQGEAALNSGFGVHWGGLLGNFFHRLGVTGDVIEAYGFYRKDIGSGWHVEGRLGDIAVRREPLGRAAQPGLDVYVGKKIGEFNVGLLYERKRTEPEYSGIMVQFRPGPVTRALGKVSFDYDRHPEGFSVQVPVWHWRLHESRFVRPDDMLVGEVRAVRIRTLWQQGFVRNQYEHRLESWGETSDPSLHCVVIEEPWYLQTEALVSPHLVPNSAWERDRSGPGQFVQRVTYRFYRPYHRDHNSGA